MFVAATDIDNAILTVFISYFNILLVFINKYIKPVMYCTFNYILSGKH